MMTILLFLIGLGLLVGAGELLVRGSVALAVKLGVSPMVIGLTVVAFGTSVPELVVALEAALGGHPDIVLGNIVGSNICNFLLIVGAALVIRPVVIGRAMALKDCIALAVITLLFVGVLALGTIGRPLGLVMFAVLVAYNVWAFRTVRQGSDPERPSGVEGVAISGPKPRSPVIAAVFMIAGIAGVLLGADLLIDGAVGLAQAAGVSEAIIGLTLVAFGTSLPELSTSVIAAIRRHGDLALGNAIGSNMFNILGITGVTAIVTPIAVPAQILMFDAWVLIAVTLLITLAVVFRHRLGRLDGGLLLAIYLVYVASLIGGASFAVAG